MKRRTFVMAGSIAGLAGAALAALWVFRPPVPGTATEAAGGDFALAAAAPTSSASLVDALLKKEIWPLPPTVYSRANQRQARAIEVKPEDQWKLTGTYRVGSQAFVLLRRGDKTPEALKAGDTLPDGRRIAEIQEERIWVVADGKRAALELRPK